MHASQDSTGLPDRSTGASRPRLVQLHADRWNADSFMVADIDVLRDGYAAANDGTGDSTAGIQKALDDCSRNGGGTVFLPAGRYSIRGSIAIPAYVTLLPLATLVLPSLNCSSRTVTSTHGLMPTVRIIFLFPFAVVFLFLSGNRR